MRNFIFISIKIFSTKIPHIQWTATRWSAVVDLTAEQQSQQHPYDVDLVVLQHVVERVVQLIRTSFDLQLLPVDLVLDVVDSVVQLRDVHLAVLKST